MYDNTRGVGSTHAEANAIDKLKPLPNNKKNLKNINILVIKTSKTGKLGMSKPCFKCIIDMRSLPQTKGYIIKNILYSNCDGEIVTTKLIDLLEDANPHVSRFYKNHNYQHPLLKKN